MVGDSKVNVKGIGVEPLESLAGEKKTNHLADFDLHTGAVRDKSSGAGLSPRFPRGNGASERARCTQGHRARPLQKLT